MDVVEDASKIAAIAELRAYMGRFAPGAYSPEMTDDEVVEIVKEMFRRLAPAIEKVATWLDENRPGWRDGATG